MRALTILVVLLLAGVGHADTIIAGGNLATQTWTPAGSPYVVNGDVTVVAGATLTISAGTVVRFASTDSQASGLDTTRVELTVAGALDVNGTSLAPVVFQSVAPAAPGRWFGVVVTPTASSVELDFATFASTAQAFRTSGTGTISVTDTSFSGSSTSAVTVLAGAPVFTRVAISAPGPFGVTVGGGSPTIQQSLIRNASSAGVSVHTGAGPVTTVSQSTLDQNVRGVAVETSPSSAQVSNSIISNCSSYGVQNNGGTAQVTYTDFFANASGNLNGTSGGAGIIVGNPLYVGGGSYALTANSPARFAGNAGQDLGAFPFTGAPTPGLLGTLWSSTVLGSAGSPHQVLGDLTVAPGTTLTLQPGATLEFASVDAMRGGADTSRSELIVSGLLSASGTPVSPLVLRGVPPGSWGGVRFLAGSSGSSLARARIQNATNGVGVEANVSVSLAHGEIAAPGFNGVLASAGLVTLDGMWIHEAGVDAVSLTGSGTATLLSSLFEHNASAGLRVSSASAAVTAVDSCTFDANADGVVTLAAGSQVQVVNSVFSRQETTGVRRINGALSVERSVFWSNAIDLLGTSGTSLIFADPAYLLPDFDYRLQSTSPCIDAGVASAAVTDFDGLPRVGPQDIGAYEFRGVPALPAPAWLALALALLAGAALRTRRARFAR
jgi:hypothetical protein